VTAPGTAAGVNGAGSTSTSQPTAVTSVTLDKPAGTQVGDVLIANFTTHKAAAVAAAPVGWTPLVTGLKPDSYAAAYAYLHVVTAAVAATANWTWPLATAVKWGGGMTRYTGVDTTHPLDTAVATTAVRSVTTSVTVPSVTTATGGAMLVSGIGADGATATMTPGSGWTESWQAVGAKMAAQAFRA
jgi:hypothetical protein